MLVRSAVAARDGGLLHEARDALFVLRRKSGDRRAAAGQVGGVCAGVLRGGEAIEQGGEDLGARGLVQLVLRRGVEQIPATLRQRGDEQRGAPDVEHGVLAREVLRQLAAALVRRHLEVRDEQDDLEPVRQWYGQSMPHIAVANDDLQATEERGRHVIGVALQRRAEGEQAVAAEWLAHQCVRGEQPRARNAALAPRPRATGNRLATATETNGSLGGLLPAASYAARRAPTIMGCAPAVSSGRREIVTSALMASASPRLSNPEPRLALVAGTRTVGRAWIFNCPLSRLAARLTPDPRKLLG